MPDRTPVTSPGTDGIYDLLWQSGGILPVPGHDAGVLTRHMPATTGGEGRYSPPVSYGARVYSLLRVEPEAKTETEKNQPALFEPHVEVTQRPRFVLFFLFKSVVIRGHPRVKSEDHTVSAVKRHEVAP